MTTPTPAALAEAERIALRCLHVVDWTEQMPTRPVCQACVASALDAARQEGRAEQQKADAGVLARVREATSRAVDRLGSLNGFAAHGGTRREILERCQSIGDQLAAALTPDPAPSREGP